MGTAENIEELNHRLAKLLRNVGNGVRITVLAYLQEVDEAFLAEIAGELGRTSNTMSRHMKTLVDYDVLRSESRGRKKFFRIKRPELVEALLDLRRFLKRPEDNI